MRMGMTSGRKKALGFLAVLFSAVLAHGQGACFPAGISLTTTGTLLNSPTRVISYSQIRVCSEPASGTPCTPLQTIYTTPALTTQLANPFQADAYGNFHFCVVSPSTVHIQISGPQVTTQDIPYVTLGVGSGTTTNPCGVLYDVQINDPLGTFGCDTGIFQEFPTTHTVTDYIVDAKQKVDVSDTTHSGLICQGHSNGATVDSAFCNQPSSTFSTTNGGYGLFPPDNAPASTSQVIGISSLTPTNVVTDYGTLPFYHTQWESASSTIVLAGIDSGTDGTNYVLTSGNLNANSNQCPSSLTTGVTAIFVATHTSTSTAPTFQLCGLGSPTSIFKNSTTGEVALLAGDIYDTGTGSNTVLQWNGVTSHWDLLTPSISANFNRVFQYFYPGVPASGANSVLGAPEAVTFPANFSGTNLVSAASCGTNPASSAVFTVYDDTASATLGTITLNSSCTATFATTGGLAQAVAQNHRVRVQITTTDASVANVLIMLRAGG